MRPFRALLHAMRKRGHRIDRTQADRLAAGDPAGSDHPGLGDLLDAVRAPGTPEELAGEKALVAAFTAQRKRAARADRRAQRKADRTRNAPTRPRPEAPVTVGARGAPIGRANRKPKPSRARAGVVAGAAGLALLALSGTAVAARTGHLPREAQQHAHRLFSALGVPAPRTGPTDSPTGGPSPSAPGSAGTPSPQITALSWCEAWKKAPSGPPEDTEDRRKLAEAAGGESRIADYCAKLGASAPTPPPSAPTPEPTPTPTPASPSPSPSATTKSYAPVSPSGTSGRSTSRSGGAPKVTTSAR